MSTIWTPPSTVIQYAEDASHIEWNNTDGFLDLIKSSGQSTPTMSPLLHIARQPRNDITMKTYFVRASGFNFENMPSTVSGIGVRLEMNRGGRITDETVQLCLNDQLIGENRANLILDPVKFYGDNNDTWNVGNLANTVADPLFGIVLRFQSHPGWPHTTTPLLTSIQIQIH
jgi:hypothetical protein